VELASAAVFSPGHAGTPCHKAVVPAMCSHDDPTGPSPLLGCWVGFLFGPQCFRLRLDDLQRARAEHLLSAGNPGASPPHHIFAHAPTLICHLAGGPTMHCAGAPPCMRNLSDASVASPPPVSTAGVMSRLRTAVSALLSPHCCLRTAFARGKGRHHELSAAQISRYIVLPWQQ
jgi:hypothetical protein